MKIDRHTGALGKRVSAIEIGTGWVKMVQVDRHGPVPTVSRVMVRQLDESNAAEGGLAETVAVLKAAGGDVIVSLPRQAVTVRTFELPSSDPHEVGDMIDLQIAKQTPYSRDEIVFGYRLSKGSREGFTRVMLVIAPSSVLRHRCRVLEDAGLSVRQVAVSTDGLVGGLQRRGSGAASGAGGVAVLDIDAAASEVAVLQDGEVVFSRGLAVGAKDVADDPVAGGERLIQEAARAVEAFRHEFPSGRVDRLFLSGALRGQGDLPDRLRTIMGIQVEFLDVLGGAMPALGDSMSETVCGRDVSVTAVAGAALAPDRLEIDLTPESILMRRTVARRAAEMTLASVLIMAALALLSLWVETRIFARQHYLDELTRTVQSTTAAADSVESMKHKVAVVKGRLTDAMAPVAVLGELHTLISADTSLSAIEYGDGRLTIRGSSLGGPESSGRLVNAMEASPYFREVKRTRTASARDRSEFEITCDIESRRP